MLYDKAFKEKLNEYCRYCDLHANCDTYQKALLNRVAIADENDAIGLWQEREQLVYQKKAVEGRILEIDTAIKNLMASGRQKSLVVGGSEFYFTQQRRKEYPIQAVREIMSAMGLEGVLLECMKLEKTKLEKHPAAKGNKMLMTMIDNCAEVSYTKPTLNCRNSAKNDTADLAAKE